MNYKRGLGFTLIELLVVISIISVLLTIIVPAMNSARDLAKRAVCLHQVRNQVVGLGMYADENNDYYPIRSAYVYALSPDGFLPQNEAEAIDLLTGLGKLYPDYIFDPHMFYCPADNVVTYDGTYSWDKNFPVHTTGGTNGINSDYVYLYNASYTRPEKRSTFEKQILTSDFYPLGYGEYCHVEGYNLGNCDGSARWYPDPDMLVIETTYEFGSDSRINAEWWEIFSRFCN